MSKDVLLCIPCINHSYHETAGSRITTLVALMQQQKDVLRHHNCMLCNMKQLVTF